MTTSHIAAAVFYALGLGASLEDFKTSRIANRWIIAGLATGALLFLFLGVNTLLGSRKIIILGLGSYYLPGHFYRFYLLHFGLSSISAVALWYLRVWPAGDAKLYIALSSLIVLIDNNLKGFPDSLFLTAAVNAFVAAGLYLAALALADGFRAAHGLLRDGDRRRLAKAWLERMYLRIGDEWPRRGAYATLAWNTFALFLLMRLTRLWLNLPSGGFLTNLVVYIVLWLFWDRLSTFFLRRDVARVSFCAVTFALFPALIYFKGAAVAQIWKSGGLTFGFGLFLSAVRQVAERHFLTSRLAPVAVEAIKPGTILSQDSWSRLTEVGTDLHHRYADGLSATEVSAIQEACRLHPVELTAYQHRPFAVWIFLGCVWTLNSPQNLVQWLILHLHR